MTEAKTLTLAEFLLAQIDYDERWANSCAIAYPPTWDVADRGWMATVRADEPNFPIVVELDQKYAPKIEGNWLGDYVQHIANWDPARVLAECEAKRRIVEIHHVVTDDEYPELNPPACGRCSPMTVRFPCETLRLLALPYADRDDYRDEWRP